MKIREIINNNANKFTAVAFEHGNKIIVIKSDTHNYYDCSTDEKFEFSTIKDYQEWKLNQEWIDVKKIKKVSNFKKVT